MKPWNHLALDGSPYTSVCLLHATRWTWLLAVLLRHPIFGTCACCIGIITSSYTIAVLLSSFYTRCLLWLVALYIPAQVVAIACDAFCFITRTTVISCFCLLPEFFVFCFKFDRVIIVGVGYSLLVYCCIYYTYGYGTSRTTVISCLLIPLSLTTSVLFCFKFNRVLLLYRLLLLYLLIILYHFIENYGLVKWQRQQQQQRSRSTGGCW